MKKFADTPFLPTEVEIEAISETEAKISAYPFESGFAITLAHPLRRLLLSSSVGYAPIAVKIEGANHEFDSLRGMLEDIAIFIINLKNIKFKINGDDEQVVVEYSFDGPKEIKGSDLANADVEIVSPDEHLATINSDCNLTFSIIVQKGIGYMPSEDIREIVGPDYIPIDAFFTPVKKVVYDIEKMLVEDNPNFEKAVFTVQTNGQISPISAFKEAVSVMYSQMSVFNKVFDLSEVTVNDSGEEPVELKDLIVKIDDLNLSARSFNSLDRAGLKFLGELVLMSEVEVKNIKNLGKKSFDEISEKLESLGFPIDNTLPENIASALRRKLEQLKA
ncbi:DNA-directed RNA polymerase subunit alpha [Malaciobacter molluscorum LMG 25693]|uniref:DNA-directed RNA polymerase subunit alpha n=1 Tax=Malaciobacter molluscorum LMG 25693 TaxID=870501 RepID=A0A2G1DLJ0_9BACT|nr:DNA-directed RNA polymerase subunit alpha [Malaciobacter molluscorum]AXX92130.1 DNA-directed RNA polymerase, alpha subunit [Malaciobacter molluscorum LMG 25693]PHO19357.1 DNA-directed RNA polymerase subunit alpha [Malaciobacter molluscorum LMG 25693]RXJ96382.1 DNA-directed RNA polymerase subunit alpha [Malaciobacter molluscorum]